MTTKPRKRQPRFGAEPINRAQVTPASKHQISELLRLNVIDQNNCDLSHAEAEQLLRDAHKAIQNLVRKKRLKTQKQPKNPPRSRIAKTRHTKNAEKEIEKRKKSRTHKINTGEFSPDTRLSLQQYLQLLEKGLDGEKIKNISANAAEKLLAKFSPALSPNRDRSPIRDDDMNGKIPL